MSAVETQASVGRALLPVARGTNERLENCSQIAPLVKSRSRELLACEAWTVTGKSARPTFACCFQRLHHPHQHARMPAATFNLPPPTGFRGLNPDLPITVYHRHLPHWRQEGATYFATFRLADALPQEKLQFLKRLRDEWERTHPPLRSEEDWKAYAREDTNSCGTMAG